MTSRMRESVERAAHVAVGAPVAAMKAMSARVSDLRETVRSSRKDLGQELAREMDEWISEGERVIERAMNRLRPPSEDDGTLGAKAAAKRTAARVARRVEHSLEPDADLTMINGIGATYESKLNDAGIDGVTALMSATGTREDIAVLAEETGFGVATIQSWRSQVDLTRVDGVGGVYKRLLHRVGVWTLSQLASANPERLVADINGLGDMPTGPDQMPTAYDVKRWISEAGRLIG